MEDGLIDDHVVQPTDNSSPWWVWLLGGLSAWFALYYSLSLTVPDPAALGDGYGEAAFLYPFRVMNIFGLVFITVGAALTWRTSYVVLAGYCGYWAGLAFHEILTTAIALTYGDIQLHDNYILLEPKSFWVLTADVVTLVCLGWVVLGTPRRYYQVSGWLTMVSIFVGFAVAIVWLFHVLIW